jgi:hypothetical protein
MVLSLLVCKQQVQTPEKHISMTSLWLGSLLSLCVVQDPLDSYAFISNAVVVRMDLNFNKGDNMVKYYVDNGEFKCVLEAETPEDAADHLISNMIMKQNGFAPLCFISECGHYSDLMRFERTDALDESFLIPTEDILRELGEDELADNLVEHISLFASDNTKMLIANFRETES